jgi:drug/metabolite transporter (DMT)-like permease
MINGSAHGGRDRLATRRSAYALLVALALIWGFHWVVVKTGLREMPPFTYATLRVTSAIVTLAVLLAIRGELRRPARSDLPIVVSVGLGQIAATIACMNLALQVVPAGRSSVLAFTVPLWVAVILVLVFRTRLGRGELLGLGAGLAGIALLLNPSAISWGSAGQLAGSATLVAGAIGWAVATIHVRAHSWTGTPFALTIWELLVALVPLGVLALVLEPGLPVRWEPATVLILLYSGPLATAFGFWASQVIARTLGPMATTVGYLAVPVVGLASGAIVLGEPVASIDVLGFAFTLGGIAVLSRATPSRPPG